MTKILRDFKSAQQRRDFLEKELRINLDSLINLKFKDEDVEGKNIENLTGAVEIPFSVAGPITIKNNSKTQDHYIPIATTEGALTASISRGAKAITKANGADVIVQNSGITRGPVFKTKNLTHSHTAKMQIQKDIKRFAKIAAKTSSHLKLLQIDTQIIGSNLYCRMSYDTQDAMGMNMATFATEEIAMAIEKITGIQLLSLAGNFDIDKKPSWLNFIKGRGRQVWAETTLSKKVVKEILKTTPEKIIEVVQKKQHLGSILSGSIGFNAHFANVVAAIFIACGQDPAHIVEGSLGITTAQLDQNGNLQFAIFMPSVVIGTVGGGTRLPSQNTALKIACGSNPDVVEFARIIGAAVLAGELSLTASLAQNTLAQAHKKLARKK